MKKTLSLILAAILTFASLALFPALAEKSGDFEYTVKDGKARITGYTGSGGNVAIPEKIAGLPVTSIAENAFRANDKLVRVTIPDSVTEIGSEAFSRCANLEEINVPAGLKKIPAYFVNQCAKLTSVTIPSGVYEIGGSAFAGCSRINHFDLPYSVTEVKSGAFFNSGAYVDGANWEKGAFYVGHCLISANPLLISGKFDVRWGTTVIAESAFAGCADLTEIELSTVSHINRLAFSRCTSLKKIAMSSAVRVIADSTYNMCTALTSVVIPEYITRVEEDAFDGCTAIASVKFLGSPAYVGARAFDDTAFFKNMSNWEGDLLYCDGVLLAAKDAGKSVTVKDGTKVIAGGVFYEDGVLETISLPASLKYVGLGAFFDCSSLKKAIYAGTAQAWEHVSMWEGNASLYYAEKVFLNQEVTEPEYTVTVIYGSADVEKAKEGATVHLTADKYTTLVFDHWECDALDFSGSELYRDENAMFRMPACSVTVTAVYKDRVFKPGDANGDGKVNSRDIIMIMNAVIAEVAHTPYPDFFIVQAADIDGNGRINAKDVIAAMKAVIANA